ncbi:hypothetical protein [Halogeometricum borinquense]|nr:hypothetical protein [Halogeometricum borinquense]
MNVDFTADAWRTSLATLAGYGAILLVMFVALFLVPYAVVSAL